MTWEIRTTAEFREWLQTLQPKQEAQIRKRIAMIELSGSLGDFKSLGEGLHELRWKNGTRVYFARVGQSKLLLYRNDLKNRLLPRRCPDFEPGKAGAEAAQLKKFSDAGGFKNSG